MNNEMLDMPKKIRLELWVNDDKSMLIKESSLELTTEELNLFYFADERVKLRGIVYKRIKDSLIQQDSGTGKIYRTLAYGIY